MLDHSLFQSLIRYTYPEAEEQLYCGWKQYKNLYQQRSKFVSVIITENCMFTPMERTSYQKSMNSICKCEIFLKPELLPVNVFS